MRMYRNLALIIMLLAAGMAGAGAQPAPQGPAPPTAADELSVFMEAERGLANAQGVFAQMIAQRAKMIENDKLTMEAVQKAQAELQRRQAVIDYFTQWSEGDKAKAAADEVEHGKLAATLKYYEEWVAGDIEKAGLPMPRSELTPK